MLLHAMLRHCLNRYVCQTLAISILFSIPKCVDASLGIFIYTGSSQELGVNSVSSRWLAINFRRCLSPKYGKPWRILLHILVNALLTSPVIRVGEVNKSNGNIWLTKIALRLVLVHSRLNQSNIIPYMTSISLLKTVLEKKNLKSF